MYRLQVLCNGAWKWGICDYDTLDAANNRIMELAEVGIKAKIGLTTDLLN